MPDLGASLFEIAQSLFALERTMILGAMALNEKKSEEQWANWQNQILIGSLMSDIRKRERSWKTHKNAQFVHILIKNDAKQRLIVVFSILRPLFHKLCVLELCKQNCERERTTVFLGVI